MKTSLFSLIASVVLGGIHVVAQTTVATNPVGFITQSITPGSVASPTLTLLSPTLTQPITYQGYISSLTSTTITVAGTSWTANQFGPDANSGSPQYYVEVIDPNIHDTNGNAGGALADITSNTATSVTIDANLTAFAPAADVTSGVVTVIIRPHVTLSTLFGATNTAGLTAGATPGTADEVLIYDGANSVSYFYFTGDQQGDPPGWYDSAFTLQAGNVSIAPFEAVVIKRKSAGALTLTSVGTVKTGDTLFPVVNGLNVLGTVSAQGLTLATSGLFTGSSTTGVTAGATPATADEVIIYSGTTQTPYFYFTGDQQGDAPGWYDSAFTTTAGSIPIAPGTAFVLKRKGGGSFNWALPSPSSF
jgi:hypothetical protein